MKLLIRGLQYLWYVTPCSSVGVSAKPADYSDDEGGRFLWNIGINRASDFLIAQELFSDSFLGLAVNSVVFSPLANYTDRAIAAGRRS
jgi:hypothetical protein